MIPLQLTACVPLRRCVSFIAVVVSLLLVQSVNAQSSALKLSNSMAFLGNYNHGTTNNYTTTVVENFSLRNEEIEYAFNVNFKYREDSYVLKSRELSGLLDVDFYPTSTWSPYVLTNAEMSYERAIKFRAQAGVGLKYVVWKDSVGNGESISGAVLYDQSSYTSPKGGIDFTSRRYSLRVKGTHRIFDTGLRLQYMMFFQPNIVRVHDYRTRVIASLDFPATPWLSFRIAANNTYENEPAPGKVNSSFGLEYGVNVTMK